MKKFNQREMEIVFEPEEDPSSSSNRYQNQNHNYQPTPPPDGQKSDSVKIGVSSDAESMLATFNSTIYSCSPGMINSDHLMSCFTFSIFSNQHKPSHQSQ